MTRAEHIPEDADDLTVEQWVELHNRSEVKQMTTEQHVGKGFRWFVWYALALLIAMSAVFWAKHAFAQTPRTATITFTRPTTYTDGTPIAAATTVTYGVYQGAKGSTSKPKVATITSTATTISTGLQPGETCWQVSAIANGVESALSNEACKNFAFPAPDVVTITVT